jgi:hypothetical protein
MMDSRIVLCISFNVEHSPHGEDVALERDLHPVLDDEHYLVHITLLHPHQSQCTICTFQIHSKSTYCKHLTAHGTDRADDVFVQVRMARLPHGRVVLLPAHKQIRGVDTPDVEDCVHGDFDC